jgi:sugar/nucleoside kinase (ribokinase family)
VTTLAADRFARSLPGSVVSVGAHILDVLGWPVSEIPPGQGSVLLKQIRATAAGTAAGTSVDLARLGAKVSSFGAVGDDALGDILVALLEREGVDTSLIIRKVATPTSSTILPIRPNGDRPALHAPGADSLLEQADVSEAHLAAINGAQVFHVGGPDRMGSFSKAPLIDLLGRARDSGAVVTLDVLGQGSADGLEQLRPLLELVDWFLPNAEQLQRLTGEPSIELAVGTLRQLTNAKVAVTRGREGCLVDDGESRFELPALEVEVVDTTGCGDGFDAGFIAGLLLGCPPAEASWLGTACGALVATGLGSDAGISSLDAALAVLERSAGSAASSQAIEASAGIRRRLTDHSGVDCHRGREMTVTKLGGAPR